MQFGEYIAAIVGIFTHSWLFICSSMGMCIHIHSFSMDTLYLLCARLCDVHWGCMGDSVPISIPISDSFQSSGQFSVM